MMAPPLAGSPRVQGHRDYIIKVLLGGLTGPLDGRTYSDVMAPLGSGTNDEWVAGVASFVRGSFGNTGGMVTPADVARVRASMKARKGSWTAGEIEASLPKVARSTGLDADGEPRDGHSGRGGDAARVEFRCAADVRDVADGRAAASGLGDRAAIRLGRDVQFRPWRRQCRARTPVVGYPRGYAVEVSLDGKTWSKPVAAGKGQGRHTTIAFAPTRAKFVRITETDAVADAPAWSVSNLRIYQAP